jgi:hypothetical protein
MALRLQTTEELPWQKNQPKPTSAQRLTQPRALTLALRLHPARSRASSPRAIRRRPGGVEVELVSDYWPAEQPQPETDPRKPSNEVRHRAGERVTLPQEEVMNLLERGIAKRVQK